MGGSTQQSTNSTSQMQLPQWVSDAGQNNYNTAQTIAQTPYNPTASTHNVADTPQSILDAISGMTNAGTASSQDFSAASGGLQSLLGYHAPTVGTSAVTAGTVPSSNLSQYINPYTDTVVNGAMGDLEHQRQLAISSNDANAAGVSAFGGSRSAIQDAVTNAETARNAGTLSGQLRSQAYDNATGLLSQDLNRGLTASQANASNTLAASQSNAGNANTAASIINNASSNLGSLGATTGNTAATLGQGLLGAGTSVQQTNQAKLDANQANAGSQYQDQVNKLNLLLSSLGMTPYNKTTTTSGDSTSSSSPDLATSGLGLLKLFL